MAPFIQSAVFIFIMRIMDVSLSTLRIRMVVRGRKFWAMIFGFFQALIFVTAISQVISDVPQWDKLLGYSTGFATGVVVGMLLEDRLAMGYMHLQIISSGRSADLVEHLRSEGYAITEVPARGLNGTVSMLNCNIRRKFTGSVLSLIDEIDPQAFVTARFVRPVQRGFW